MVAGLAAGRENEVVADFIAAAKAVVCVDSRPGAVEEDITADDRLGGLCLHEERRLLLVQPDFARRVAQHRRVTRVLTVRAVHARLRRVGKLDARAAGSVFVSLV